MADILSPIQVVVGDGAIEYPYGRIKEFHVISHDPNMPPFIEFSVINYRLIGDVKEDAPTSTLKTFRLEPSDVALKFMELYALNGTNGSALIVAVREGLLKLVQVL